ncbi:MAG: peptide chain release factor N(5)-glutamine methyltransferase [bacterium]
MTAAALLGAAAPRLAAAGIDSARLDAEVLLAHALGFGRTALYARLRDALPVDACARFEALLARRERREPVAYLTGVQEFWSLPFGVTPDVLIPRPETELLVELALQHLPADAPRTVLDIGTGSACIAVAIARERPLAHVTAVDISRAALAVAHRNAVAHGVDARVTFAESDLFDGLAVDAGFDLIVSNPPYLAPNDAVSPELASEPRGALYAGADGLAVIRRLVAAAADRLRPGGRLLIEIGQGQSDAVVQLARAGGLADPSVAADLAHIPRVLVAQRATK